MILARELHAIVRNVTAAHIRNFACMGVVIIAEIVGVACLAKTNGGK